MEFLKLEISCLLEFTMWFLDITQKFDWNESMYVLPSPATWGGPAVPNDKNKEILLTQLFIFSFCLKAELPT